MLLAGLDGFQTGPVGSVFVVSHGVRHAIVLNSFGEVTARCSLVAMGPQQEINRVALVLNGRGKGSSTACES